MTLTAAGELRVLVGTNVVKTTSIATSIQCRAASAAPGTRALVLLA
jgi:hypothetical protein